jgi:hypothetical protein
MRRFQITGIRAATGARRTRVYQANSEAQAKVFAEVDGTLVNVVEELAAVDVSDTLLETACKLGVRIPDGISAIELSDLICTTAWRDTIASARLRNLASDYGVIVTAYAGQGYLYQRIFDQLRQPANEHALCAWFAYQVFRDLAGHDAAADIDPNDPLVRVVARLLLASSVVVKSIHHDYLGADLVSFDRWMDSAGVERLGASRKKLAYKHAKELLRPFVTTEKRKIRTRKLVDHCHSVLPRFMTALKRLRAAIAIRPEPSMSSFNLRWFREITVSQELFYSGVALAVAIAGFLTLMQ